MGIFKKIIDKVFTGKVPKNAGNINETENRKDIPLPDTSITALVVADTHNTLTKEAVCTCLDNRHIDSVILLGDIGFDDWYALLHSEVFRNAEKISVPGNHDTAGHLEMVNEVLEKAGEPPVKNIHGTTAAIKGVTFAGIGYSAKYKNSSTLLTQKEAADIADQLPKADILISHSNPKFEEDLSNDISGNTHKELWGICKYLKEKSCAYNIHGHIRQSPIP